MRLKDQLMEIIANDGFESIENETTDIRSTLAARGSRYGSFEEQGKIEQNIKRAFADSPNWDNLPDDSKSALEMIATKISRILKGDPEYHDSWHDIVGYAQLVADRIERDNADIH